MSVTGLVSAQDVSAIAASIAVLIAFSALVVAARSYGVARRSLAISEKRDRQLEPGLSFSLQSAESFTAGPTTCYIVRCCIANLSDAANSIRGAELYFELDNKPALRSRIGVPHSRLTEFGAVAIGDSFSLPEQVPARQVRSGSLIFVAPLEIFQRDRILYQSVEISDTFGTISRQELLTITDRSS